MNGRVAALAVLVVAAGLGVGAFFLLRRDEEPPPDPSNGPTPPASTARDFREAARESGINFRMAFLPNEQGAKFKINLYDHGCGVAVGDYDSDGHDDIYFLNQLGANALYRNKGDGTFEDVTQKAGVGLADRICVGAVFADYDNDGRLDLYVTSTRGGNVLFRNRGDGTFEDATKKAHLTCIAHSQTAAFFDYDKDGHLDLFVTNTAKWTLNDYDATNRYFPGVADFWQLADSPREYNVLYRNNGKGAFTDETEKMGLKGEGWGGDVAVFDFDDDGWLDLLVTNMFGASQLYRNNAGAGFTDVRRDVLGSTSWGAIGAKVFDFNNDGRLDVYIVDMHSDMWLPSYVPPDPHPGPPYEFTKKFPKVMGPMYGVVEEAAKSEKRFAEAFGIHYDEVVFGNTFFKNVPGGKFVEISEQANLETFWPWGIAAGDFNNDGFEDVFLPSGMGHPYGYWPNALLMNKGDGTFHNQATETGVEPPRGGRFLDEKIGDKPAARSSRCAATGDFDGDGRLDLIVNNFNDHPYYFRNHFPKKNYVAFDLVGTKSNRDAVGALVHVHTNGDTLTRQVHTASGYLSQSSRTVHVGLGDRPKIDFVEIRWPSGIRQRIDRPAINKRHQIIEREKS